MKKLTKKTKSEELVKDIDEKSNTLIRIVSLNLNIYIKAVIEKEEKAEELEEEWISSIEDNLQIVGLKESQDLTMENEKLEEIV